jgi:hypothetical protein
MATLAASLLAFGGLMAEPLQAGHGITNFSIGVGFGPPVYYRPYWGGYGYYPYYYRPYPVYVAPPPVIVQPAPVVQTVPTTVVQPTYSAPPPTPVPAPPPLAQTGTVTPVSASQSSDVNYYLQQLSNADERVRSECVIKLGKLKATRAIDPLAATLAGDRSPVVRESAARALGLIGSAQALPALQYAAQSDNDRDVRRSAQFAVDVIQSRGN